jgi:hypothetical protein
MKKQTSGLHLEKAHALSHLIGRINQYLIKNAIFLIIPLYSCMDFLIIGVF